MCSHRQPSMTTLQLISGEQLMMYLKIREWNWCSYLLKHLFQAVRKFKTDVIKRNPTIHIVGCHLVLQVFVLDSLDLDLLSKLRGMFLRMALFDYDSMKKMIESISVNMGAGEISFHGASVRQNLNISKEIVCATNIDLNPNKSRASPNTKRVQIPSTVIPRNNYGKSGPLEFSKHLRTKYPSVSGEKLGILLREHNARGLARISEMRESFQNSMFSFADKIVICIAENCMCCKANGRKQCILKSELPTNGNINNVPTGEEELFVTPIANKIVSRFSAPVDNEGHHLVSGNYISTTMHVSSSTDYNISRHNPSKFMHYGYLISK
ncbi:uncharacterized protein [Triticum aestivum]|uniref:uncharacterized protein n=1 Tax=Triticum aestivum TaxID=4565 RepID=UPI001D019945|nr:uncharacterized protein LOC123147023 [Triticum aestivum]